MLSRTQRPWLGACVGHLPTRISSSTVSHHPFDCPFPPISSVPHLVPYPTPRLAMLTRPACRIARSASSKPQLFHTGPPTAATSQTPRPLHQRRQSSSKASHPPGAPRNPEAAAGNGTNAASEQSETSGAADGDKKQPTRISRRKSKEPSTAERAAIKARDEAFTNLPAVPPTNHLQAAGESLTPYLPPSIRRPHAKLQCPTIDVHLASLFSLHRPISVSRAFPPDNADKAFNSIFETRQGHRPKDVIYTISNAVAALDGDQQQREEKDLRWEILQQSSSNAEPQRMPQAEQQPAPSLEDMVKQFKPFNTPPPPVPMDDAFRQPQSQNSARAPRREQRPGSDKHFSTTLTITEHTSSAGSQTYSASTTPFIRRASIPFASRQPFLARLQDRQNQIEDFWDRRAEIAPVMELISVKRQRKLKMKKHKYKKLMRRTRNLRRREGRT